MNRVLLIWNLVLTVVLAGGIFMGCTTGGPDVLAEVRINRQAIEQLANITNANREAINSNKQAILATTIAIETSASTTTATIKALQITLQQWVEQFVKAYVDQAVK